MVETNLIDNEIKLSINLTVSYANCLARIGDTEKALNLLQEVREETDVDINNSCVIDTALAFIYWLKGNFNQGLQIVQNYIEYSKQLDPVVLIDYHAVSSIIHRELGNFILSIDYAEQAMKLSSSILDDYRYAYINLTLGNTLLSMKLPSMANRKFRIALNNFENTYSILGQAASKGGLAEVQQQNRNYVDAFNLVKESLRLHSEIKNIKNMAYASKVLGKISFYLGMEDEAIDYLEDAIGYSQKLKNKYEMAKNKRDIALLSFPSNKNNNTVTKLQEAYELIKDQYPLLASQIIVFKVLFLIMTDKFSSDKHLIKEFDHLLGQVEGQQHKTISNRKFVCKLLPTVYGTEKNDDMTQVLNHCLQTSELDRDLSLVLLRTMFQLYLIESSENKDFLSAFDEILFKYPVLDEQTKITLLDLMSELLQIKISIRLENMEEARNHIDQFMKFMENIDLEYLQNSALFQILKSSDFIEENILELSLDDRNKEIMMDYLNYSDNINEEYSMLFHDINNLLFINIKSLELAEQTIKNNRPLSELIHSATVSSKNLSELISELRSISESSDTEKSEISLSNDLGNRLSLYRYIIEDKEINLNANIEDTPLTGNRLKISRIIDNLVSNAIKFTDDEGKIKITLENKNGWIKFSIYNSGDPIPKNEQDKIFDKFYRRKESHDELKSGHGLGLYFCNKTVKEIEGEIVLESPVEETGEGVKFNLEIPIKPSR